MGMLTKTGIESEEKYKMPKNRDPFSTEIASPFPGGEIFFCTEAHGHRFDEHTVPKEIKGELANTSKFKKNKDRER